MTSGRMPRATRIQVPSEPSGSAISLLISVDPIYAGSAAEEPAKPVLTSI